MPSQSEAISSSLTIKQLQEKVDNYITTIGVRYFSPLTNMAILTEEVGEVARIIAREHGEQSWKEGSEKGNIGDELADVLWVVICLANQLGVDLDKSLVANLLKKENRDKDRHIYNPKIA